LARVFLLELSPLPLGQAVGHFDFECEFQELAEDQLDFVLVSHRGSGEEDQFAVVFGPVALAQVSSVLRCERWKRHEDSDEDPTIPISPFGD
jgi:hypothetical protein